MYLYHQRNIFRVYSLFCVIITDTLCGKKCLFLILMYMARYHEMIKPIYQVSIIKCNKTKQMHTSQWAWWCLKSPASRLFTQPFIRVHIKVNIIAPRHWPLWIMGKVVHTNAPTLRQIWNFTNHSNSSSMHLRIKHQGPALLALKDFN